MYPISPAPILPSSGNDTLNYPSFSSPNSCDLGRADIRLGSRRGHMTKNRPIRVLPTPLSSPISGWFGVRWAPSRANQVTTFAETFFRKGVLPSPGSVSEQDSGPELLAAAKW